jgi:3',5'-cyclic AMP phosphodiesterase CpdA/type II secretory pathway predicted ATPase ExeA
LHVSDAQFGAYHRFGDGVDSLASRLITSLRELPDEVPHFDLVIFSGDAAETGMDDEFAMAAQFLRDLLGELSLSAARLVVVPGNHDVNWKACQGFIFSEQGEGRTPAPPYAPKWAAYERFLGSVYGAGQEPPLDCVRRFPELGVTIAALNSTIDETHEVHRGFCGEEQLQRHAQELRNWPDDVRLAVVHHNVRKNAADRENLDDDEDFMRLIGPHVDVVLHGHTHNGRRDHLNNRTLVLSTGSTALTKDWRPEEVPNQFQALALTRSTVRRWAYAYVPAKKAWLPDANVGTMERVGYEVIELDGRVVAPAPVPVRPTSPPAAPAAPRDPLARLAEEEHEISEAALEAFRRGVRDEMADLRNAKLGTMEILDRLGLLSSGRLTRAATLLFGLHPQRELPSAIVQSVQYHGSDRTATRESRQVAGTAMEQVDGALAFLRERVGRRERPSVASGRSEVAYEYPMTCVREVLVNAIVHRDYGDDARYVHARLFDDRIEISSPGGWTGLNEGDDVELRSRVSESVRRNPRLAAVMSFMRYFEGEGSGVPTAISDSEALGAPAPRVRVRDGFVVVTIYPSLLDPDLVEDLVRDALRGGTSSLDTAPTLVGFVESRIARADDPATMLPALTIIDTPGRHVLIVGDAGLGKTTLLRQTAMRLAKDRRAIPVAIAARELVGTLQNWPDDMATLLAVYLRHRGLAVNSEVVAGMFSAADVVLLIDGLDELPDNATRRALVEVLDQGVERWPRTRVIATSRAAGIAAALRDWTVFELQPWSRSEMKAYLEQTATEAGMPTVELLQMVDRDPLLQQLAASPLTLNMLIRLFASRGTLPERRIDLYDQAVDLLISGWDDARRVPSRRSTSRRVERQWCQALAVRALEEQRGFDNLLGDWCINVLVDELDVSHREAQDYLGSVVSRPALLTATAEGVFGFLHLAFAEYLAAEGIVHLRAFDQLSDLVLSAGSISSRRQVAELAVAIAIDTGGGSLLDELLSRISAFDTLEARIVALEILVAGLADAGSPRGESDLVKTAVTRLATEVVGTPDSVRAEQLAKLLADA